MTSPKVYVMVGLCAAGLSLPLHTAAQSSDGHPAWSPLEDRVAFERFEEGRSTILVIDVASREVVRVGPPGRSNHHPSWSPDGRRIAYSSNRDGNLDIYIWDLERGTERRVTDDPARDETPSWASDGHRIAFGSKRDGGGLHVVDVGTGEVRPILPPSAPRPATRPSWSPDGKRLVFHAGLGDAREIYVMELISGSVRRLTANGAVDAAPEWSPDGGRIVFHSRRDGGKRELYMMTVDGGSPTRLTEHEADDADGSWSPGGDRLVFYSDRSGEYRLWLLDLETGAVTSLQDAPG